MARGQQMEHRGEEHKGLSLFDGVLIVGGGLIALFVVFEVVGLLASVIWFFVKVVIAVVLVALVFRLVFRRRS